MSPVIDDSGATGTPITPTTPVATTGNYNITVRYVGDGATARQRQAVAAAVARWQSVITGDVADISGSAPANSCFEGQPELNERIDDIVMYVDFKAIDGAGQILGEAGPCYIRNDGNLPLLGYLQLDLADLDKMERLGTLDAVVLHEMGHVLGIGTLWPANALIAGAGGTDPRFTGIAAIDAYHALGGADANVPVEDVGADGTRDGHWRETVFGNELMTGYISGATNPMSAMTIASLRDMGYNANTAAASTYSFATSMQRVVAGTDLHAGERVRTPWFQMSPEGRATRITPSTKFKPWGTR
jgi:hypothetical protein